MAPVDAETVYTIATLPKPFDAERGLVQSATVHSIRGSRKRKRHEVVVGIDGESLSIYSLQSQNLASSYALPPQTFLCCPPASTYCRQTKQSAVAQRRTYAVVRDGFEAKKQKLLCFTESNEGLKEATARIPAPTKLEHKLDVGEIVGIEVLPSASSDCPKDSSGVLVTYGDGRASCVSPDLSGTAWTSEAEFNLKDARVVFAATFPVHDALKGLLAGRQDIAATLSASTETTVRQLMLRLVLAKGGLRLALFSIRLPSPEGVQSQRSGLTKIMEYDLPVAKKPKEDSEYDFHATSGKLYQLSGGRLTIYDLSGTIPFIQRKFGTKAELLTSFARISSSSIVAVTGNQALVYETRYGSVQQAMPLTLAQASSTPGSKRKSLDVTTTPLLLSTIAYFSDLGSLVLVADTELVVAPITDASKGVKKAKFSHISLSDVIESAEQTAPPKPTHQGKKAKLESWQSEFNAAVDRDDSEQIERLATKALRLKRAVHDEMEQDSEDLSDDIDTQSFDIENIDRRRVLHILETCFKPGQDQDIAKGERLLVAAGTTELFKWLALTGSLTIASIRQALVQQGPISRPAIVPGDIMVSMSRRDETCSLMFDMLALPVHWDVEEVVSAIRLLAQSFQFDDRESQVALPATVVPDEDVPMVDGDTTRGFESETLAAEKEYEHAMNILDSGFQIRNDAFRLTLQRLHTFPSSTITMALRSFMTQRQLLFFINILRNELSAGGWIKRYTDSFDNDDNAVSDEAPDNRAIKPIADILSCAVDAIGTSGWLIGLSGEGTNAEEFISALRAEISACLEGSFEASTLETMIDEVERYREIAKESGTLFKEKGQQDISGEEAVLPVGLRVEAPVLDPRDGKKAHIKAKERNRRVGLYSFEKIRF